MTFREAVVGTPMVVDVTAAAAAAAAAAAGEGRGLLGACSLSFELMGLSPVPLAPRGPSSSASTGLGDLGLRFLSPKRLAPGDRFESTTPAVFALVGGDADLVVTGADPSAPPGAGVCS